MSERFDELRGRIADNDRAIVAGVNERLRLVAELWELKDAQGASRVDPEREARLREALVAANDGPLVSASNDGSLRLWDWDHGQVLNELEHRTNLAAEAVATSRDGTIAVSGGGLRM